MSRGPTDIFLWWGVQGIFGGLKFWPKGIFWGREFLWVLYFSSAQINNNISAIYCLCGLFVIKFADTETLRVVFFWGGGML